ncbi:MAG: hypothetical protein ACOYMR_13795 [Ilumatobacteraceae bacterium]
MTSGAAILLAVHLAATAAMVGLIWFVQVVHYPMFDAVGRGDFAAYEVRHQRLTSYVVGLPMATEGVTALVLFFAPPAGLGRALPFVGLVVLAVVLGSTVLLQVPAHERLNQGFDAAVHRRLVRTNWIRTVGWTLRGALAVAMLVIAAA